MSPKKFKALVHHVIHMCKDRMDQLGAVRLNKILWFADAFAYQMRGSPITEETYVKRKFGPVPRHILRTLEALQDERKILIVEPEYPLDTRKFISLGNPNEDDFDEVEKRLISHIADAVLGSSTTEVSELTHDLVWETAREGEEIPLNATLVANKGVITNEFIQWANGVAREYEGV